LLKHKDVLHKMTDEPLFQITFAGRLTGEFDLSTTKQQFQKLFKISTKQLDHLFLGNEIIIKSNITEPIAMSFAIKIAESGCECSIGPMPDANDPSSQAGFVNRRKGSERRIRFRRGPRAGAIVPDRRLTARRKTDILATTS
jgi:hypothetical protein